MKISVILCTYNPREDYLKRTLRSLREQTLSQDFWEFLIVDNNSDVPVKDLVAADWHPQGRVVVEEKPGLTHARVCGINHSSGELLVFVDDDNILATDYLSASLRLAAENPMLMSYGAAILKPEYAEEPHPWLQKYVGYLAVRSVGQTKVGCDPLDSKSTPWGAGLCVRRDVAVKFKEAVDGNAVLGKLGRKGSSLLSGEDLLFSWLAVEAGGEKGIFEELSLIHLISADRVQKKYLVRIGAAQTYSATLLHSVVADRSGRPKVLELVSLMKAIFWKSPFRIVYEFPFAFQRWRARGRAWRSVRSSV